MSCLPVPAPALLLVCAAISLTLAACKSPNRTEYDENAKMVPITNSETEGSVLKMAQVESVTAEIKDPQTLEATVVIRGMLPDGATQIHDVQKQKFADGWMLTVITARPRNAVASLALVPYERTLTLSLKDMAKGKCRIAANNMETTVDVP